MPSTIIRLDKVTKTFEGKCVLPEVDLDINAGDFLAVTGPNGGGKTTLLRIILGLTRPSTGRVTYYDGGKRVRYLHFGYLPQKSSVDSHFPITVAEVVESGLLLPSPLKKRDDSCREALDSAMETFGVAELRDRTLGTLSGGQMQRTLLARACVSNPDILVLDEPLSYLDSSFAGRLHEFLESIATKTTVIVVSHDMSRLATLASRHLIVDQNVCEICRHAHPHPITDF